VQAGLPTPEWFYNAQAMLLPQGDLTGAGKAAIPQSTVFGSSHMRESGHLLRQAAVPADKVKAELHIIFTEARHKDGQIHAISSQLIP